jgi:hypothetical protein
MRSPRLVRVAAALAVAAALDAGVPGRARAADPVVSVAYVAVGLVTATTAAANLTFWAYDEGAPRGWRIAGYVSGAVELAVGAGILVAGGDPWIGGIPLALGAAAVCAAWLAPPATTVGGPVVAPVVGDGAAGVAVTGTF